MTEERGRYCIAIRCCKDPKTVAFTSPSTIGAATRVLHDVRRVITGHDLWIVPESFSLTPPV